MFYFCPWKLPGRATLYRPLRFGVPLIMPCPATKNKVPLKKWLPPSPGQEVLGRAREVMPEAEAAVRPQTTGVLSRGTGANGAPSGHRWDNLSIMKMNKNLIFYNCVLKYYRGHDIRSEICLKIMERGVLRSMWWQRWHKINHEQKSLKLTEVHTGSLY